MPDKPQTPARVPPTRPVTRRGVLLGAAALGVAGTAPGVRAQTDAAQGPARASAVSRALFASQAVPSLSLAVAAPRGLLWTEALGKTDVELDVAATAAHRFKLGSVSKVLTATAAAKLVSRGTLDLEAPIVRWLPDLPAAHRQTTMNQLLTHRGGVRHYIPRDIDASQPGGAIDFREYPSNKEILDLFIHDPLVGPPGAQVFYSTFGFTLASLVIEAAAQKPFPEVILAEIGAAFGLPSLDTDAPQAIRPNRVRGYNDAVARALLAGQTPVPGAPADWTNARQTNPAYKWAGGGFLMTPSDLALFGAALLDSSAAKITASERTLLFTPLTAATPGSPPLGLGWRVDADGKGRRRWHHAGAQEGGRASIVVYPDLGLSIALASSAMATPGNVLQPSSDLADAFA